MSATTALHPNAFIGSAAAPTDISLAAARRGDLPASIPALLDDAPKYPGGAGFRVYVASAKDLPAIRKLARIKLEN